MLEENKNRQETEPVPRDDWEFEIEEQDDWETELPEIKETIARDDRKTGEQEPAAQDVGEVQAQESAVQDIEVEGAEEAEAREQQTAQDVGEVQAQEPAAQNAEAEGAEEAEAREQQTAQDAEEVQAQEPAVQGAEAEGAEETEAQEQTVQNVEEAEAQEQPAHTRKKRKWPWILAAVLLLLIVGGAGTLYGLGVYKYSKCFLQGTFINGVDCSNLEPVAVCRILDSRMQDYELEVSGRNPQKPEENIVLGTIAPGDIDLRRKDTEKLVGEVFAEQDAYRWYEMFLGEAKSYDFDQDIVFETERLEEVVRSWAACGEEGTIEPRDAQISEYLPQENAYRIVPEEPGTKMDVQKMIPLIRDSLYALNASVDIEESDCYYLPEVTADDPALLEAVETVNEWLGAEIRYDWYGTEIVVDAGQLSQWVSIEDGTPSLDEEAIAEFVKETAAEADPNGHFYDFKTSMDAYVNLKCITGWTTDCEKEASELAELIRQGATVERTPASSTYNYVQFHNGVGNSYVEVDMTNQQVYLYYEGELILKSNCVTGDMATGHRTPEGIYALKCRMPDTVLRGDDYESFVYFWMPFYRGYGLHDATWRNAFGGKIYQTNGSHGCVNLPYSVAQTIYSYMRTGYPVICYYYPEGQNPAEKPAPAEEQSENPAPAEETPEEPVEENEIHGQY